MARRAKAEALAYLEARACVVLEALEARVRVGLEALEAGVCVGLEGCGYLEASGTPSPLFWVRSSDDLG